jgi:hypothetical protein
LYFNVQTGHIRRATGGPAEQKASLSFLDEGEENNEGLNKRRGATTQELGAGAR